MTEHSVPASRARLWVLGARPRTLTVSIAPVIAGTAVAGTATPLRTAGCLIVALSLQIGVNYANDYADGVRGHDTAARTGPVRLVASGAAPARAVATAALLAFFVAGVTGLLLARVAGWGLLIVGGAALLAAAGYSAGPKPYASLGLGEAFVFVFFGIVATCGTAYVQSAHVGAAAWWSACSIGLLAVAVLVANNLRDIPTDAATGKRTLAVRLGDAPTRALYRTIIVIAFVLPVVAWIIEAFRGGALLCEVALLFGLRPMRAAGRARGRDLVPVLVGTVAMQFAFACLLAIGTWAAS